MSPKKTDYTIVPQQNLIKVVMYLATDVTRHTTVREIAEALELKPQVVSWTLHNLRERAWVEQSGDGWRLGPGLSRLAESVRKGLADSVQRYLVA